MKAIDKAGSYFLRVVLRRMKELGLSQTELAKRMDASRPYVVKVLHGEVNITLSSATRFAHALQMDFTPVLTPRITDDTPQSNSSPTPALVPSLNP